MKSTLSRLFSAGLLLALAAGLALSVFAQGTLTPPAGAPAPTMKSLDQVEARTIVNATNTPGDATNTFIIRAPGSYYLTGNITGAAGKHGISIQANDVTLDLNGFALISGGSGTVRGVNVPVAQSGFSVRNGSVRGWYDGGVRADTAVTLAEKLVVANNTGAPGLAVGNGSLVKDCVAWGNGTGFYGGDRTQFSICISTENTADGFTCTNYVALTDCTSSRNGGAGFLMAANNLMVHCSATRNRQFGILTGDGCSITDCTAASNVGSGIEAVRSTVTDCTASSNTNAGLRVEFGVVTNSVANANGHEGIIASFSSVSHCTANNNGDIGINAYGARIENSGARYNSGSGIRASNGAISNCTCDNNSGFAGIEAYDASITNCTAIDNSNTGIHGQGSVIAFCRAKGNNQANNGSVDLWAAGAVLTGNKADTSL